MSKAVKKSFLNGCTYEGQVNEHSQAEGFGILRMPDSSYYEG